MILDTSTIIKTVNEEWLKETGIEINLKESSKVNGGYDLLKIDLSGDPVEEVAKRFGTDGKLFLRWLLPNRENGSCIVRDQITGDVYTSGMVFRRDAFDKEFRRREDEEEFRKIEEEIKDTTERTPLHLCPNLDRGTVYPAWWHDIEAKWKRFADGTRRKDKEGNVYRKCGLDNFIRLEAGLNAVFVSSSARNGARFDEDPQEENVNPLLALESKRQVLIDLKARTLGRLRIPHATNEKRLCPFQTPESNLTGLKLNLAADAVFEENEKSGTIKEGKELLSAAVGLVPYPNHTDGPRLMMGGKNMKQSEKNIVGAEPPIVPGRYEGFKAQRIKSMSAVKTENGWRFPTPIGLNALTVIMPWQGYTYEDGLVISESLAERLCIKESPYKYKKVIKAVIYQRDLDALGIEESGLDRLGEKYLETVKDKNRYVYGDPLPGLSIPIFETKTPNIQITWNEIYTHHAPGILKDVSVMGILERTEGSKAKKEKRYYFEITICWKFTIERPMGLGDKLTGRNGNKGVVTKVLSDAKMPKIHFKGETRPAELIISPSSIMGRKNLGQIWEMMHSLLIKLVGEKLKAIAESSERDLDLSNISLDDAVMGPIRDNISVLLQEMGSDERGTFEISGDGVPNGTRAFAGWQYFCRLHHHAWKKLQARGEKAPYEVMTGQPMRCGARTGQRMGEMENWSLLSQGANDALFAMQKEYTGHFGKTRDLLEKVLRSLGIVTSFKKKDGKYFALDFLSRQNVDKKEENLKEVELQRALREFEDFDGALRVNVRGKSCRFEAEGIRDRFRNKIKDIRKKDTITKEDELKIQYLTEWRKALDKLLRAKCFFNKDGSIHLEPDLMQYESLRKALMPFALPGSGDIKRAEALFEYQKELVEVLSHKTGIPRLFMLGRRYNHSGRAVIVPEPSLRVTETYLPAAMLIELLDNYNKKYIDHLGNEAGEFREMRKVLNDFHQRKAEAIGIAGKIDEYLKTDVGELWCFLVRQPSLHRHSVQAFRIRCWAEPVIGLPPFVTPGFNADFDGDTMAVFLPPYEFAKDMGRFSILETPGLVGTGKPAFADGLDLALGWWNIADKNAWYVKLGKEQNFEAMKYSNYLPQLLKVLAPAERGDALHELQETVCKASTGSATLTPLEFDTLCKEMKQVAKESDGEYITIQKTAKMRIEELRKEHENFGLFTMINSGAKGKVEDVLQMVWAIGNIGKMKDEDYNENTESVFIKGNFWRGLKDDELFDYSYPSRYSMAQKKLSVADAGYFTRQLAEGLYDFTVRGHDCGTKAGLEITYSEDDAKLRVNGILLPTLGSVEKDLMRVAWGRVPLGSVRLERPCLNEREIYLLVEYLKTGNAKDIDEKLKPLLNAWGQAENRKIIIRSPLYCEERNLGHVCPLCYGADLGIKPYDAPQIVKEGFAAGITAAQAIGERGTQLAMKRFHDVSGSGEGSNALRDMRGLLISHKIYRDKETKKIKAPLQMLLEDILYEGGQELPQALVHFEVALAQSQGLKDVALRSDGCYLSALAGESIKRLLIKRPGETFEFSDNLTTIKSRLIWEGNE